MLFTEGEEWKKTRSLFNPGFAAAHLMTLVPSIVEDTKVYCKVLDGFAATGETFQVEEAVAHLTIDIMGHVVLDHDLNSQTETNELVESFRKSIQWTPKVTTINPFVSHNPILPLMHKYYAWKMDNYVGNILDARYISKPGQATAKRGRKPAIDLALDEYALQEAQEGRKPSSGLDKTFRTQAIDQMKTFLFAGHDTSSSTICFIYHLLSRHPEAADKVRKEHDEIFGADPGTSFQSPTSPHLHPCHFDMLI
jgi:cytochrome P450